MGCAQSKTNEQEMVHPTMALVEVDEVEPNATADKGETSKQAPVEVDSERAPVIEVPEVETSKQAAVEVNSEHAPVIEVPTVEVPTVGVQTAVSVLKFVPGEVSFNESGVSFYNFKAYNPADPSQEQLVCKRYSEFKAMHVEMAKLMASEKNVRPKDQDKFQTWHALPSMPQANAITFVLGRGNTTVVKDREAQFVKILNAIAHHPIAFRSDAFQAFLA